MTLCTAAPSGGGGTFDVLGPFTLVVPASILAGTYTATLTVVVM